MTAKKEKIGCHEFKHKGEVGKGVRRKKVNRTTITAIRVPIDLREL